MSQSKIDIKPIHLILKGEANLVNEHEPASLHVQFSALAGPINDAWRQRQRGGSNRATSGNDPVVLLSSTGDFLQLMASLDAQYGADGELPLADIADAVDVTLRCLAELESWLARLDLPLLRAGLQTTGIGVGYWAMRHGLPIRAVELIVNALAEQANRAASRQETAATYALTQGFIQHLKPGLQADLERSDPERPWRLLNLNFAITAIRTGDPAMMRFAFDSLNTHLPDERAGFYAEAQTLASQPGFPAETRALIEAECRRWTLVH